MDISIIGMPLFYGCDKPGVEKGPEVLRRNKLIEILEENHYVTDIGDIEVDTIESNNKFAYSNKMKYLEEVVSANNRLASKVLQSLENYSFPLVIGGDHSLALGSLAGSSHFYGENLAVIWIDAHGDINTVETSPTGNIHGMPLAASMGVGYEKLTSIFFDKIKVKPENVFIVGCRDLDEGEIDLIEKYDINVWNIDDIQNRGIDVITNELLDTLKSKNIQNIHLSYDIDCLDPEYVPGTGTPVHNGLTFEESKKLLECIFSTSLVKSMDFVEYNPDLDENNKTLETCMELIKLISSSLK